MSARTSTSRRLWVAVVVAMTSAVVAAQEPSLPERGLVVEAVTADSVASKAGLTVGDRIAAIDGKALRSTAALQAAEENTFDRSSIALNILRGEQSLTVRVPPGKLGVQVRPALPLAALTMYEEGRAVVAKNSGEAITKWASAAQLARDGGDAGATSWLLTRVGDQHETRRQWKDALDAYAAAWKLLQEAGDAASRSRTMSALGRCSQNLNDYPGAIRWFERAALADGAAGYEMWEAANRNSLGVVVFRQGDLTRAEEEFTRALEARTRRMPDSLDVAASLNNLGIVAANRGDYVAAHDFHSRSLALKERLAPDSVTVGVSLTALGNVAQRRGDLEAAHNYHSRALAIKQRLVPDSLSLANTLESLGNVARTRSDLAVARDHYRRSLEIRERLEPDSLAVASSLTNLGSVAFASRDLPAAERYHRRALEIRERLAPRSMTTAASLSSIGEVAREQGDFSLAERHHRRALEIQEHLAPRSLEVVTSLSGLGLALGKARRFSDAIPLYERAIDIVETHRWAVPSTEGRALLMALYNQPYAGLLRTHVALGDFAAAFATVERGRARSLLELLVEARAYIREGINPELVERERALQSKLNAIAARQAELLGSRHTDEQAAAANRDLDALLAQYRDLQAEIRTRSPRYAGLMQPQPLGLRQIQERVLDKDTLLLEYALGEESSHLFAVSPTSIRVFELPPRATIDRAARRFYELLTARQAVRIETPRQRRDRLAKADREIKGAAQSLSQMVVQPAGETLADKRLLVVADGALQLVPFAALPWQGRPLIIDHEIVSVPSASVIAVLRSETVVRPRAEGVVAVLADPVFDREDSRLKGTRGASAVASAVGLPRDVSQALRRSTFVSDRGVLARLPFTRDEAKAIMDLAPPQQSRRALDFSASRATALNAELGRYRIVHLATHGVLDTERPELSGLVLSLVDERGESQDGFLRLHEVYNLKWAADLVVLSACQTALGKEINGEGLVGLTRGFMYGGARHVLASLWNVNDGATAEFMKHFYRGLLGKSASPAAALRMAQMEMWRRRQWRAPYYWAGFVLQGEWK